MVAPNPQLRIPPSGPLTTESGGGSGALPPPLNDVAGYLFRTSEYVDADQPLGTGNDSASGCKIGPLDQPNFGFGNFYRKGIVPADGGPGSPTASDKLSDTWEGASDGATAMAFTEGTWLVEATISAGYNTSAPVEANAGGNVVMHFYLMNDSGETIASESIDELTIAQAVGAPADLRQVQAGTIPALITVTADMIAANGGPIKGFNVQFQRYTGTGDSLGAYGSGSGWWEVNRQSTLMIRRYG